MVDVSKQWAQSVSKADFVKILVYHKDETDLGQLWESLQEPKKVEKKAEDK